MQSAVLRLHVVCLSVCLSVRPSVGPSVTLVNCDHIGWNSSQIISPLVSLGRSLFATPTYNGSAPRGTPLNLDPSHPPPVDLSVGDIRSQIAAEWLQIAQRSQWRAYGIALSKGAIADPLRPPLPPKWRFHMPQHTRMAISLQRVIRSCLLYTSPSPRD